jgi:hypothetical protein
MSVEHLAGKRTGRKHGSKNRAPWVRAVRWAYAHLGDEGTVPPSPLAGLLLEMGRREPDRLVTCLALADAASVPKGNAPAARRLLRVSLPLGSLPLLLAAALPSWRAALPQQYEFAGLAMDEGQPVPLRRLEH